MAKVIEVTVSATHEAVNSLDGLMLLMQNQIFRFEKKSVAHLIITMLIINVVGEVCHTFFNTLE